MAKYALYVKVSGMTQSQIAIKLSDERDKVLASGFLDSEDKLLVLSTNSEDRAGIYLVSQ
jgi:hypothetical protein